ncbi:MAG: hypothetical protein NTU63_01370 [Candidatus Pacearchaeota archaeon]|nr:hypothetical protein [Candidatus Pacearchaeota archaeon]
MKPQSHFLLGIFFVLFLFFLFPQTPISGLLIIFLSSILIDVDHYLYYVFKKGDKSIIRAYKWFTENRKKAHHLSKKEKREISFGFLFLHGVEILIALYFLYVYVSEIFLYLLIGFGFHLLVDIVSEGIECGKFNKISIIYSFLLHKRLKFIDDIDLAVFGKHL